MTVKVALANTNSGKLISCGRTSKQQTLLFNSQFIAQTFTAVTSTKAMVLP